jgi:esterase/lipase superfamily enzyme
MNRQRIQTILAAFLTILVCFAGLPVNALTDTDSNQELLAKKQSKQAVIYWTTIRKQAKAKPGKVNFSKKRSQTGPKYGLGILTLRRKRTSKTLTGDLAPTVGYLDPLGAFRMSFMAPAVKSNSTYDDKKNEDGSNQSTPGNITDKEQWLNAIETARADSGQNLVHLFTHGAFLTYDTALKTASGYAFCNAAGRKSMPVVAFDYPTDGSKSLRSYFSDENNSEWADIYFVNTIATLEKRFKAENLVLSGHSLGNRILCRGLRDRYKDFYTLRTKYLALKTEGLSDNRILESAIDQFTVKYRLYQGFSLEDLERATPPRFNHIFLLSPDVDRRTFEDNYSGYVTSSTEQVDMYVSTKDQPLRWSKTVHRNQRLGQDLDWTDQPCIHPGVRINRFGKADRGKWGHANPFEIVNSEVATGTPGPGWRWEVERDGDCSVRRLVKVKVPKAKQRDNTSQ